jgi:nitrogen-specific signal transduction histidine kinase/CheY-like chemotaxis protein
MPVTIHSSPIIQDEQIVGIRGIIVDISEAKKREKERLVLSKLESTGMLAAGLAHDFNNLLAIILGNLQVAKMSLDLGEQIAVFLDAAEKGVLSARELTRQLITFSKEELPIKKPVVLSHLLREQALFTLSGSSVKSDFSFAPDLWAVEADENQLAQSFRNIILNSREAMPQGGIIMVKAENVEVTGDGRWPLPTGNYVKITISDQGSGIPEKILPRIFDPYFSTKQRGIQKGMGLGLTICHSVIKKHGGLITATSKPDEGTTMTIYLPASATQISIRSSPKDHAARDSKILIMDDEEMVRTMARALLGRMGFQVEVAEKGEQAVELYQKAMALECPFDAVILDLTVRGGMGGKETIEKLLQIDPGVRAIVSSGYDEDPVMRNYDQYGFKGVLAKPYLISDLSDALAKVLKPGKRERAEKIKDQ